MKTLIFILIFMTVYQVTAQEAKLKQALNLKGVSIISEMKLPDFHKYHVDEFAKAPGFGEERIIIMPKIIHLVVEEKKYRMSNMRLLSVTDRKKPILWELPQKNGLVPWIGDGIDRSMLKNKDMKKRSLTKKELMSMTLLRQGKERVLGKKDDGVMELMAPLHAGPSCIRCHEDYKKGEFMGAFLYTFGEVGKGLFKKENKTDLQNKEDVLKEIKEVTSK